MPRESDGIASSVAAAAIPDAARRVDAEPVAASAARARASPFDGSNALEVRPKALRDFSDRGAVHWLTPTAKKAKAATSSADLTALVRTARLAS